MKRIIPLIFILFLLTACSIKEYTPEIPLAFTRNAKVSSGDFLYDCEICKNDDLVKVTVLSTSAKGMVMTCNSDELVFSFGDYDYTYKKEKFDNTNIAVVVYDVFSLLNTDRVTASKIDGGYKYQGEIGAGSFELIQNDDNTIKTLSIKSAQINIEFE